MCYHAFTIRQFDHSFFVIPVPIQCSWEGGCYNYFTSIIWHPPEIQMPLCSLKQECSPVLQSQLCIQGNANSAKTYTNTLSQYPALCYVAEFELQNTQSKGQNSDNDVWRSFFIQNALGMVTYISAQSKRQVWAKKWSYQHSSSAVPDHINVAVRVGEEVARPCSLSSQKRVTCNKCLIDRHLLPLSGLLCNLSQPSHSLFSI